MSYLPLMPINESAAINIGPRERLKRRVMGVVSLLFGAGLAFWLIAAGAPRWSRIVIFFPLWIAGLGLLQAREKTCIALAARGLCNMDAGEEAVKDQRIVDALRVKARRINRRALMIAAAITLVALASPRL
jgi:hypothetical protein